ncbi:hypothetical protein L3X37_14695 [Sabulilitoribacter arenilitoris]|uniref:Uncharacterized protein n=1 Tax=Wocania arenilitoris TaxID=2044858 RepID=A0AAE3ET13_9FLAO|nr:hypothetical protein [Wocania arenilitoris]MCF7569595.1 hypothetical protein [Wocania arenilitoris]
MVYNNLGLTPRVSEFNNPKYVKEMGFNGMTPHWYVQCGITYDLLDKGIVPEGSEERKWIETNAVKLNQKIKEAQKAGVKLYPFTDFLVVPKSVWKKYGKQMVADEFIDKVDSENYHKPDIRKEMTKKILRIQIAEIFETFPDLDGLMLRFGETYLHDTPHHLGNSPLRKGQKSIPDNIELLKILREEVCVKRNKTLFYRTWVHDIFQYDPATYLAVTNQVEPHPNLIFAVKHTHGDFFRTVRFNQTLAIGNHQQVVEVQCQREYEGKQAHPNYIAKGVIEGFEEYDYLMEPEQTQSLNDIKDSNIFAGVWTWSRGGGWLGPHLKNEFWAEQNAYVMSKWAQNTSRSEEELFTEFARYKGFSDDDIPKLREISLLSAKAVLRGKYTRYGSYSVVWTRDQYIHGSGMLKKHFDYVIKEGLVEAVLAEKKESVDMWKRIEEMAGEIKTKDVSLNEYLVTSAKYGRIKYEIIEKGWIVMLLGHIGDQTGEYEKNKIREAIGRYDELWEEWKELEKTSPSCATIYEPNGFAIRGHLDIYGNPETGIGASVDKYRKI